MRIPGLGGKVFKKAGGNPVLMAGGEIYTALERGALDATEWVAPFHDMRLGLNRAADYYYYPGWHEPGTVFELMLNLSKWQELGPDLQKIVEVAAAATSEWIYAQMEYNNQKALQELRLKKNVTILSFPDDVLRVLKDMTKLTLAEESENSADFKRVYEAYEAFREDYNKWNNISEEAYSDSLRLQ
jgi:TRAP-type mannitol/chloroaromatic compound transport system substrate-binding protein